MQKIEREIERTAPYLEAVTTDDGRYVRIADGENSWWQPVEEMLPLVAGLPDYAFNADDEDDVGAYVDWCRATGAAGFFGHNAAEDTMGTPTDFVDPRA